MALPDDRVPCEGCGKLVLWANHERTGNPAPLIRPGLAGVTTPPNVIVTFVSPGEWTYRIQKKDETLEGVGSPSFPGFINHFADCKQAAQFKRKDK